MGFFNLRAGAAGPPGAAGAPGVPGQTVGNALLGGGGIVHTGLLNITVAAANYMIAGVSKASVQTDLSLGTADPTDPRIDVIALNSSGAAVVVAGVAAASPFEPVLDPATQIRLTAFQVNAGATVLTTTSTIIYTEGGVESWTESASGAPMTVNSATSPITDTVSCRAVSSVAGNYFQFANGSDFDTSTRNLLALKVRLTAAMPSQKSLVLQWYDGTIARGTPVPLVNGAYGFSRTLLTAQLIPIPMAAFGVTGLPVDTFRITTSGGGNAVSYTVDDIIMQAGVGQAQPSDAMRWRGQYSAVVQYQINDVVESSGIMYVAIATSLGVTPVDGASWTEVGGGGGSGGSSVLFNYVMFGAL